MLQFAIQRLKKSVAVLSMVLMVVSASAQSALAFTVTDVSPTGTFSVTPTPALDPSILASIYTPSSSLLSNAKATPSTFKPSNGEQTTIHFDLAAPSMVWLDIMQNGTTVNRLYFNAGKHMLGGGYDTFWNGLNGSGVLVNDGTYQFLVTAQEDTTKQTYTAQDNIIVTSAPAQLPVVITTGSASPNPINPDLGQITTVNYTLNTTANLNIEVVDGSTPIVQLSSSPLTQNAGTYPVTWNGKYSNGTKVTAKTYYIRFTGSNIATPSPYVTTVPVTVDYNVGVTNAKVQYVYAENASFNPNTSTNRIHYAVDKSTTAVVKILDASNNAVKTYGSSSVTNGFDYFTNWDGRSDSLALVPAGNYTAKVELYNGATLVDSKQSAPFAVNFGGTTNTAPVVTFITATPSNFNPTNSETTSINYAYTNTSGSAILTNKVEVIDGSSVVRKTFTNPATVPFTWNGRDESNNILPVGTYTVRATVANAYGPGTNSTSVVINNNGTTNNAPVVTSVTVNPSSFNPSNNESTTVSYTLDKAATSAMVQILDGNNTVRRTISGTGTSATSTNTVSFNGRDDSNNILASGTYTTKVSATNAYGTGTNSASVSITNNGSGNCDTSNGTPNLTSLSASPSSFDPNNQSTTIYYTLDRSANVTVEVLNSSSTLVRTLSDNVCQNSGANSSYSWNGRDTYNTIVNNGSYTIRVRANNGSGTDTEYTYVNVNTNGGTNNGAVITGMYVQPEIFNPRNGQTSTAYYNLSQTATVTTEIIDRNSVIVRTLVDNITRYSNNYAYSTSYGSYNYADQWNGRDRYNNIVPDNVYQFRVTARSSNGGTTDVKTAWVEVDTDGVIIGFPNGSTCAGYIDVSTNSPYCKAIQLMKDNGVFSGYTDGTFRPYQQINRAETVKVILLALGLPVNNGIVNLFSDTDSGAWYAQYLSAAKSLGIIRGYPDGTFRPNQTVNRVELLKVFLESSGVNIPYCNYAPYNDTPVNADTRWYIDYACFAKTNGLMHDDGTGRFSPAAPMTRGDVADLFYQFENKGLYNKNVNPYYNGTYNNNYNNNYNNGTGYPVVSNVYVSPTSFNPANAETTIVYYTLSQSTASSVRVQILDSNGTIRRTLSNGSTYNGTNNSVTWNGRDDSNNMLSNGTYTVRVTADNGYGSGSNSTTVYLNNNGGSNNTYGNPVVTNVYATPTSFRAYNNESTTVYYTLSQNITSSVQVQILDSNGTIRRTIYNGGTSYGTSSVVWNGRDDNGNVVASATYTAKVVANNSYGTTTNTTTVTVY